MPLTFTPGVGVVFMRDGAREATLHPHQVERLLDIWDEAGAETWFNDLYEAGARADAALPRNHTFRAAKDTWAAVPEQAA